jgi:hypothetical protein
MADGFLGRWSRRKLDAQEGIPLVEEPSLQPAAPATGEARQPVTGLDRAPDAASPAPPPLTLEDAQALKPESDFGPFAARGVAPDVQHAAMRKLFSDPHYNVMDRLDTYIDDYSLPDPIPAATLRQLASAKFLGLFDQEEKDDEAARQAALKDSTPAPADDPTREAADNPTAQTVAQSAPAPAVPSAHPHDHPDMRLQPDDAPPGETPGGSAE